MLITYTKSAAGVNWPQLGEDLVKDNFRNGRTAEELARSFANSASWPLPGRRGESLARHGRCRMGSVMPMWWMCGPIVPFGAKGSRVG
jgi:hypothetical protein